MTTIELAETRMINGPHSMSCLEVIMPMTNADWKKLEEIDSKKEPLERRRLLELTRKEDEHPEWYESECECLLCMSYAD